MLSTRRPRGPGKRIRAEISVCALVNASPELLAVALEGLRELRPEVVLAVDDRTDLRWNRDFNRLADVAIRVPFLGFSRTAAWLRAQCSGAWVIHLDSDEVPASNMAGEIAETIAGDRPVTHAWIPRRWLYPDGASVLAQWPWRPDYQLRLFRNDPALVRFPGRFHELTAAIGPCRYLRSPLYHANLLTPTSDRLRKVARYEEGRPGMTIDGLPFNEAYYLPERRDSVRTAPVPTRDRAPIARFLRAAREAAAPAHHRRGGRSLLRGRPRPLPVASAAQIDAAWERRLLDPEAYRGSLTALDDDLVMPAGGTRTVDIDVRNDGTERWPGGMEARPQIRLGWRWRPEFACEVPGEGRTPLPCLIAPGQTAVVPVHLVAPDTPGRHVLEVDLVHEDVRWFGCGLRLAIRVHGPRPEGTEDAREAGLPRPSGRA